MGQHGVTLIQMLFAVALLAGLTQLGVSSYSKMSEQMQDQAVANQLAQALRLARNEALLRHRTVRLEAQEGGWAKGWRMVLEGEENPLLREHRSNALSRVAGTNTLGQRVRFGPLGAALHASGLPQFGSLYICERSTSRSQYRIALSRMGHVSLRPEAAEQPLCASGLQQ